MYHSGWWPCRLFRRFWQKDVYLLFYLCCSAEVSFLEKTSENIIDESDTNPLFNCMIRTENNKKMNQIFHIHLKYWVSVRENKGGMIYPHPPTPSTTPTHPHTR